MKTIPISAAERIAKDYGYDQVIVIARKVGDAPDPHGEHCTTYGINKAHCEVAARAGDFLKYKVMGWAADDTTDDQRRIAACLKACEDISTEVLELNATAGGVANLERQRNELRAALQTLVLFTKPSKSNAVAMHHALRTLEPYKPAEPEALRFFLTMNREELIGQLAHEVGRPGICSREDAEMFERVVDAGWRPAISVKP
jgi:hypothetical protein